MDDLPAPMTLVMAVFAIFVAVTVGSEVSDAKSEAVIPLLGKCAPILFGEVSGVAFIDNLILCGLGAIVFLGIPGTIGIGLIAFRSNG